MGISVLFFVLLGLKNIFKNKKLCVICASVILTWIILLVLLLIGAFGDKIIIAILMSMTALGIYYLLERKVKKKFMVFRLPLLLSFIFIIYMILEDFNFSSLIFITALWVLFFIVYLSRTQSSVKTFFKKIVECCKRW
jgi:hypothetical protein